MQNIKSLDNLIQKPVLGRNDHFKNGHEKICLYSYEDEMMHETMKIGEPQRSLIQHQLLNRSHQN